MKNILVTGVSRGIGEATARILVEDGCFVYGIFNTNQQKAKELEKELTHIKTFQCDFSQREETLKLITLLKDIRFDGIVNSAGVFFDLDFEAFDMARWEKCFEINLHAPLLLIQGLKDSLNDGGAIVNISSTDGMVGATAGFAYAATKACIINLTQSLANLFASRTIRVNNVAPGWIGDGMQSPPELLRVAAELNPLKRLADYKEVADAIVFLLSEKASYINGTTLVVDGGDSATNYILQKESEILGS